MFQVMNHIILIMFLIERLCFGVLVLGDLYDFSLNTCSFFDFHSPFISNSKKSSRALWFPFPKSVPWENTKEFTSAPNLLNHGIFTISFNFIPEYTNFSSVWRWQLFNVGTARQDLINFGPSVPQTHGYRRYCRSRHVPHPHYPHYHVKVDRLKQTKAYRRLGVWPTEKLFRVVCACVRVQPVARSDPGRKSRLRPFPFPIWLRKVSPFPFCIMVCSLSLMWIRSEIEVRSKWTRSEIEVKSKWSRSDIEVNSKWDRSEIEVESKWNRREQRSQIKVNSKWHRSEVEANSKWNRHELKWHLCEIKAYLKWNRSEISVKSKRIQSELKVEPKWDRSEVEVKPKWHRSAIDAKLTRIRNVTEATSKWNGSGFEVESKWTRSDIEAWPKWNRSETEVTSKWNRRDTRAKSKRRKSEIEVKPTWNRCEVEVTSKCHRSEIEVKSK